MQTLLQRGYKDLSILKRQATVSQMYATDRIVVEQYAPKNPIIASHEKYTIAPESPSLPEIKNEN